MRKKNKRVWIPWLLAALILLFSFLMSSFDGVSSNGMSGWISEKLANRVRPVIDYLKGVPKWKLSVDINYAMRKAAHVAIYFGLTAVVALGIRAFTRKTSAVLAGSFLIVLVCAAADELHQVFVSGRGASTRDILVDLAGVILALACVLLYKAVKSILKWLTKE